MEIKLAPRKLTIFLSLLMLLLLGLHVMAFIPVWLGSRVYPFGPLCLDVEQNLPSFFSTVLLICIAVLTGCIAKGESERFKSFQWRVLSIAFLMLSFDENTEIHERLNEPIQALLTTSGIFYYSWIIVYLLLVIFFVIFYFRFFFRLPKDTKGLVALAALLFVGGAIGMEMASGICCESFGRTSAFYFLTTVEEVMEMSGCIVFIYAFSNHIDKYMPDFRIRITSS